MNTAKLNDEDFIDFLIATPRQATATEAARCQPTREDAPAHDAFTRLLQRLEPQADALWREVEPQLRRDGGVLIVDDSVLDKPYARKMELVHHVWSGKHKRVVKGIDLITLLWSDGDRHLPCDYRLYDKSDGKTKNDHFQDMITTAHERGFQPRLVLFDSWYASLENLKIVRKYDWKWLTQVKGNRRVNPDRQGLVRVENVPLPHEGKTVHLEGYGLVKVFLIVAQDGDKEYWMTNSLEMTELDRLAGAETSWKIEEYHRGLKQFTNVERCQARRAMAQRTHIGLSLRAFVRLEHFSFHNGISWFHAKLDITRDAVRNYLKNPRYHLPAASA